MISNVDLANADVNIEKTMKKITIGLKTWHFNMRPKYSYEYFLQRCQALGSHKQLQVQSHPYLRLICTKYDDTTKISNHGRSLSIKTKENS